MSLSAAANYGTSPGVFRASLEALGFILNAFKILPHASATVWLPDPGRKPLASAR